MQLLQRFVKSVVLNRNPLPYAECANLQYVMYANPMVMTSVMYVLNQSVVSVVNTSHLEHAISVEH